MSEEITEREEFIQIVGILAKSNINDINCCLITKFIVELAKENQQLKEELQKADSITQSCIFEGKEESEINFRKAINLIEQYKSVLDEIREYIEHKSLYEEEYDYDYEENMYLSGLSDEKAKDDILQILDKVKE